MAATTRCSSLLSTAATVSASAAEQRNERAREALGAADDRITGGDGAGRGGGPGRRRLEGVVGVPDYVSAGAAQPCDRVLREPGAGDASGVPEVDGAGIVEHALVDRGARVAVEHGLPD